MPVKISLQVFALLDMHEQLDAKLPILSEVLASTSSGNVLKVSQFLLTVLCFVVP